MISSFSAITSCAPLQVASLKRGKQTDARTCDWASTNTLHTSRTRSSCCLALKDKIPEKEVAVYVFADAMLQHS